MRRFFLQTLITLAALAAASIAAPGSSRGQNLLTDPGFELGFVPNCNQAVVPDTWFISTVTPDVYSFDCATLRGLAFGAFGNFPGLRAANDGLRFVAGGHFGPFIEAFGQRLGTPLTAGLNYRLSGYFTLSHQHPQQGVVDVYLSDTTSWQGTTFVGSLGETMVQDEWQFDSLSFQAPANAATARYLIIVPRAMAGPDTYFGTDSWSLEPVEVVPTRWNTWGRIKLIYR